MTADEIRATWKINNNGSDETVSQLRLEVGCELAAQVAELNESRKPRWVNLSNSPEPRLIDATQVIGLSCGYVPHTSDLCVNVWIRGMKEPFRAFGMDHDEVRALLGIDEGWRMQMPAPVHPDYLPINKAEWNAAKDAVEAARNLIDPNHTTNGESYLETLKNAISAWDDFQQPF